MPMAPSRMNTRTDNVPRLPPSSPTAMNMAKVCMVKGTVMGIEIQEQIAMTTAIRAMYAMSRV